MVGTISCHSIFTIFKEKSNHTCLPRGRYYTITKRGRAKWSNVVCTTQTCRLESTHYVAASAPAGQGRQNKKNKSQRGNRRNKRWGVRPGVAPRAQPRPPDNNLQYIKHVTCYGRTQNAAYLLPLSARSLNTITTSKVL